MKVNTGLPPRGVLTPRAVTASALLVLAAALITWSTTPAALSVLRISGPTESPALAAHLVAVLGLMLVGIARTFRIGGAAAELIVRRLLGAWEATALCRLTAEAVAIAALILAVGLGGPYLLDMTGGLDAALRPLTTDLAGVLDDVDLATEEKGALVQAVQVFHLLVLAVYACGVAGAVSQIGAAVADWQLHDRILWVPATVDMVYLSKRGGFTGSERQWSIRASDLTPSDREELDALVFGSGFFSAPPGRAAGAGVSDAPTFVLTVRSGRHRHSVTWWLGAPPGVLEICSWVEAHSSGGRAAAPGAPTAAARATGE